MSLQPEAFKSLVRAAAERVIASASELTVRFLSLPAVADRSFGAASGGAAIFSAFGARSTGSAGRGATRRERFCSS